MSSNGVSLDAVRHYADNTSFGGRVAGDDQKKNAELHNAKGQQRVVSGAKDGLKTSAVPLGRKDVLPAEEVNSKTLEKRNLKAFHNKTDESARLTAVEGRTTLAGPDRAAQMGKLKAIASAALGSREGTGGGKGYLGLGEDGVPVKFLTHWRERMSFSADKLTQDEKKFVNDSTNRLRQALIEIASSLGQDVGDTVFRLLRAKQKGDVEFFSRETVAKAVSEIAKYLHGENGEQFQWKGVVHAGTVLDTSVHAMFENRRHAGAANRKPPETKPKVIEAHAEIPEVSPETDTARIALQNASLEQIPDVAENLQTHLLETLEAAVDSVEGENAEERAGKVLHNAVRLELGRIATFYKTSPLPEKEKAVKGQAWMMALSNAYHTVVDAAQEDDQQMIAEGRNEGEVVQTDDVVVLAKEQMASLLKRRFTNDDDVAAFVNQFYDNMVARFAQDVKERGSLSSAEKVEPPRGEKQKVAQVQAQKAVESSKLDPLAQEYGRVEVARARLLDSESDEEAILRTIDMANEYQTYMTAAVASKVDSKKDPAGREALLLRIARTELKAISAFVQSSESGFSLSDRTRWGYACILALRQAYLAASGREKMLDLDAWHNLLVGARADQNEAEESEAIIDRTSFVCTGLELVTSLDRLLKQENDAMLGRFLELARHSSPRLAEVKVNAKAANEFEASLDDNCEKEYRELTQTRLDLMMGPSGNGGRISGTLVENYRKAYRIFLKAASGVYLNKEGSQKIMMAVVQDRAKGNLDKMVSHALRLELERIATFYRDGRNGSDEKVLTCALWAFVALMETWAVQEDDRLIGERMYNAQVASLYSSLVDAARAPTPAFVGQLKESLESLFVRNFADENDLLTVFTQWAKQLNPPQRESVKE